MLWVGALSLVISLLFFMAYNWNELGRIFKFFIVESFMGLVVVSYFFVDNYEVIQKVLLMLASITLGILLALIGQTYQTGADPWQLFAVWALLMSPWAFFANFSALWILWILLINLSAILYFQKFNLLIFNLTDHTMLLLFTINAFLWTAWSFLEKKFVTFQDSVTIKILSFFTILYITFLITSNIYAHVIKWELFALYAVFLSIIFYIYRVKKLNFYIMFLYSLSMFIFFFTLATKVLSYIESQNYIVFYFFIIFVIIILTTTIVSWLKRLKKELL